MLLLGLGLAWLLAGSLARPLRGLAGTARSVAGGDLDARAPVEGSSEQREVAAAFNDMTARSARALRSQREFVANASHQLRTPLTGLRLRLESAALKANDPAVERDLVAAERETVRLARLLSELLTLARERERPEPEQVSLSEVGQFHRDMANPKMDARMALELNRDSLSLSKERQVEAVIVMDELAANYEAHSGILEEGTDPGGAKGDWPKHPSSSAAPPPVNMPVIGGPRPKPSSVTPKMPNGAGGSAVPEGFDGPKISRPELPVQTGLDSVQGGTMAPPTGGGSLGGGAPGGGHGVSGGTGGAFGGAIPVGGIGAPGGGAGSGARGAGGMRGGGMPGAAGGSNAARGGAAGRTGAQARTRGGMAGKPGGPMGGAKQGGSGLHRSRGGLKAGTGQGGKGMAGAPGAKGNRNEEKERTTKQRPDYLVEDEETWTPQRNVAPRVIE